VQEGVSVEREKAPRGRDRARRGRRWLALPAALFAIRRRERRQEPCVEVAAR
jgi:hypothetical protein